MKRQTRNRVNFVQQNILPAYDYKIVTGPTEEKKEATRIQRSPRSGAALRWRKAGAQAESLGNRGREAAGSRGPALRLMNKHPRFPFPRNPEKSADFREEGRVKAGRGREAASDFIWLLSNKKI